MTALAREGRGAAPTDGSRSLEESAPLRASSARGLWLVLMAATLWGTTGILYKVLGSSGSTNALSISFLRLSLSVPFLLLGARVVVGSWGLAALGAKQLMTLARLGAMMALYQLSYVMSIERVGVAVAVLITMCGAPVVVALISWLFLGERLRLRTLVTMAMAVTGTILLVGWPDPSAAGAARTLSGLALALAAATFQALYVLSGRAAGSVCHPLHSAGIGFGLGALLLLPAALAGGLVLHYTPQGWAFLLYIAMVPTAIGQALFLTGLRSTSATSGAIASLLEPLTSTILAVVLLNERLGASGALGAAVLLGAIVVLQWQERAPRATAP